MRYGGYVVMALQSSQGRCFNQGDLAKVSMYIS